MFVLLVVLGIRSACEVRRGTWGLRTVVQEVIDNAEVPDHCDLIHYSYRRKGILSPSWIWVMKNVLMSNVVALLLSEWRQVGVQGLLKG